MITSIVSVSMTSADAQQQAGTNSPEKGGGVFIDQFGERYEYEPGENWYNNHLDIVRAGEKEELFRLKDAGYQASLRRPKADSGAPAEWDHLVVSTTREETELLKGHEQEFMEALIEALHSTPEGRKMMAISYAHDDTGNLHWHINLHRFAVDHENKSISTSRDLTKNSVVHQTLARINEVMRERGLLEMSDFVSRDGRPMAADRGVSPEVHDATKKAIQDAGAVDITEPVSSLVRGLVPPDLVRITQAETTVRQEVAQITQEIVRLRELQERKSASLADLQSAKSALAERDQAIKEKELAMAERNAFEERATKAEATQDELTAKVLNLTGQVDELQLRIEDTEIQLDETVEALGELNTKYSEAVALAKTTEEKLEKALAVSETWEKAAKEEIELHGGTVVERDSLKVQVATLEVELREQAEQFAKDLDEQNKVAKTQMESLNKQFEQQVKQAENFITSLSDQNKSAQAQIEKLTDQMQQQANRFTKELADQANRFTKQIEKALASSKEKRTAKAAEPKATKPVEQKPDKQANQVTPLEDQKAAINAAIKASVERKQQERLKQQANKEDERGEDDLEKDE